MNLWVNAYECWVMDFEYRQRFSQSVQQIIKAQGFKSARKFAIHHGLSASAVRQWLAQETLPSPKNLELLAKLYGLTVDDYLKVLRGDDPEAEPEQETVDEIFERVRQLPKRDRIVLLHRLVDDLTNN